MLRRLTQREVPVVKAAIHRNRQGGKCPLCDEPFPVKDVCLDHDHVTGQVRGALCRNCNGIEGKIKNLVVRGRRGKPMEDYLGRLILYWLQYKENPNQFLYPTHKTEDEKRVLRNTRARKKRAANKAR